MIRVLRLVLILAVSFGALIARDGSSSSVTDMAMTQMDAADSADGRCDGCNPTGFADGQTCEGGCPVPWGASGTAGILAKVPSAQVAMPFVTAVRVAEPLIPLGAKPSLDPFPPKLPV